MERVAFIIEETGECLSCMLNPQSLVARRSAGIQPRQSVGGLLTGTELADDPLLYTNGGRTELMLHLVFDVTLPGSSIETTDVRDLTRPLWNLAENNHQTGTYKRLPLCRFGWGKQWEFTGVITAVAERLESFTTLGKPRRSWLTLKMQRVMNLTPATEETTSLLTAASEQVQSEDTNSGGAFAIRKDVTGDHTTIDVGTASGERLDQLAHHYYGDVSLWRRLALHNDIDNPMDFSDGFQLEVPSLLR